MQSPLLSSAAVGGGRGEGGGGGGCCPLLFSSRSPTPYTDQDASQIIEQIQRMARAKRHQIVGIQQQQTEAELDALACTDRQQALSFVRIAMEYKAEAQSEQLKYEQLVKLCNKIESARRNVEMASTMFSSAKTLQQVLEQMPGEELATVMDELRDLFVEHQQVEKELARPLIKTMSSIVLDDELDKLIEKRETEREARVKRVETSEKQNKEETAVAKQVKIANLIYSCLITNCAYFVFDIPSKLEQLQ